MKATEKMHWMKTAPRSLLIGEQAEMALTGSAAMRPDNETRVSFTLVHVAFMAQFKEACANWAKLDATERAGWRAWVAEPIRTATPGPKVVSALAELAEAARELQRHPCPDQRSTNRKSSAIYHDMLAVMARAGVVAPFSFEACVLAYGADPIYMRARTLEMLSPSKRRGGEECGEECTS